MHLTLKKEATKPAAENFLVQQARFDNFIEYYNTERPHQALNMQMPAELYKKSPRPYQGLEDLEYPFHDRAALVTNCGRICYKRRKINVRRHAGRAANSSHLTASGSSASMTTTSATSIPSAAGSSPSKTRSVQKCYLCLRYNL